MLAKITVAVNGDDDETGTVTVEYNGQTHTGSWSEEDVDDCTGDSSLLRAALYAWDGQDTPFEIEDKELSRRSQGWWSVPS